MFSIDLRNQFAWDPNEKYERENGDWGGPACCRIAMTGYPPGAKCSNIPTQAALWSFIQVHNKEPGQGPWGYGWYSDPFAVTKALNNPNWCPPQHAWIDVSGTNDKTVLYTLLRYMANYKYPALVCCWNHDYWSVVVYYETSDDPRQVTNPTLDAIGLYHPNPPAGALGEGGVTWGLVQGSVWMQSPYWWGAPCGGFGPPACGQIWKNKWVGIGEPPEVEGSVQVEAMSRAGKTVIGPRDAASIARRFLAERRRQESGFMLRRMADVRSARPMLVRELPLEQEEQKAEEAVRYYVIPFVHSYDLDETGAPLARLSVLVNAHTGQSEELRVFPQPVRYLSEREVRRIASRNLDLTRREEQSMQTELVSGPLGQHVSTALPAWRVAIGDRALFIAQTGVVLGGLYQPTCKGG